MGHSKLSKLLIGKFKMIQAYIKRWKRCQIYNNLILHIKEQDKEEQVKSEVNKRKEIIKSRVEINMIGTKRTIEKSQWK